MHADSRVTTLVWGDKPHKVRATVLTCHYTRAAALALD